MLPRPDGQGPGDVDPGAAPGPGGPVVAVEPGQPAAPARPVAPLGPTAEKGLRWLAAHQLPDGGWGQGDESPDMGSSMNGLRDRSNVADTSMAVLALLRGGSTPTEGPYRENLKRGVGFILGKIEGSDATSMLVTDVQGTRVQAKIGAFVDTFASLMVLTELRDRMGDERGNQRLNTARLKVLAKIERNQQANGTWGAQGWAPTLSQAMAARGLNRAAQAGDQVDATVLRRVEEQAQAQFDGATGGFRGDGAAGVDLYAGAATVSGMRESVGTRRAQAAQVQKRAATAATPEARAAAQSEIRASRAAEATLSNAEGALIGRLGDPTFVQGFGNNGGEEFLSYLLVSESLLARQDGQWSTWNTRISRLLAGVQNEDGSWSGHHCITGRTFCTATALLVLAADRAPQASGNHLRGA